MLSTIGKKLVNLQRLPYMPPNLVNFGPETADNGWQIFAHPLHFRIGRLPALPHGRYITAGKLWHVLCSGRSLQSRITEFQPGSRCTLPCI